MCDHWSQVMLHLLHTWMGDFCPRIDRVLLSVFKWSRSSLSQGSEWESIILRAQRWSKKSPRPGIKIVGPVIANIGGPRLPPKFWGAPEEEKKSSVSPFHLFPEIEACVDCGLDILVLWVGLHLLVQGWNLGPVLCSHSSRVKIHLLSNHLD